MELRCPTCNLYKDRSEFYADYNKQKRCKDCQRLQQKSRVLAGHMIGVDRRKWVKEVADQKSRSEAIQACFQLLLRKHLRGEKIDLHGMAVVEEETLEIQRAIIDAKVVPLEQFSLVDEDTRRVVSREVKVRDGQSHFREMIVERYNGKCAISGCGCLHVLQAAHIKEYRGQQDHHPENGILLRSDLHRLFDLDLMTIDPETMQVCFHPDVVNEYQSLEGTRLNINISRDALCYKWNRFQMKIT